LSSASEARQERRRVLLLFSGSILPPLLLLSVLAVVAARNDEAALNDVEAERARNAADRVEAELTKALRAAEAGLFAAVDASLLQGQGDAALAANALRQVEETAPLARRFFVLDADGDVLWPQPRFPFREANLGADVPREDLSVPSDFRRLAELQALYDLSLEQQRAGALEEATRGFQEVASSDAATQTLSCRASFRLGACLEQRGQSGAAERAYAQAAAAQVPVRGELGRPLRVEARLAAAELGVSGSDASGGAAQAAALGRELVAGGLRLDLTQSEWFSALERAQALLSRARRPEDASALAEEARAMSANLEWLGTVEREGPTLAARLRGGEGAGETRTYAAPGRQALLLAYQALGAEGPTPLLLGVELDPGVLARDVFQPLCASLSASEEVIVRVLDAEGAVVARGAGDGATTLEGGPSAAAPLAGLGWRLDVSRSRAAVQAARRNRLLLYSALIGLTLLSAVAGAMATIRYVERNLELAKMKSDFLSNITHELKTPLTSIKMYGEMLAAGRLRTEEKRKEYAEHIVREGDRLQKLIENVLDFARQDSGQHEYVLAEEDVADTVSEAVDLFRLSAKARGFDLFVELPPVGKHPPVDLDRDAVVRSVLNLLSNAVKYSTDRRRITVSVKRENREAMAISVEDQGIGIAAEDLERIFDRFYRAGDENTRGISGAGLGLSLVDHIVRAHQGQIEVESEKGQGSTFTISLPVVEDYRDQWPPPPLPEEEGDPMARTADETTADGQSAASGVDPEDAPTDDPDADAPSEDPDADPPSADPDAAPAAAAEAPPEEDAATAG
jgi:signal transduction histidine kinase/tetratricopeptide (TPR) repeat protein